MTLSNGRGLTVQAEISDELIADIRLGKPAVWLRRDIAGSDAPAIADSAGPTEDARRRFVRFQTALALLLGDGDWDGSIGSALIDWPGSAAGPTILVKGDHALPMTGSIKARGGVHEVLKYVETIALSRGLVSRDGDYAALASPSAAVIFGNYEVSVASTGNLGFSVGLVGRAFGLRATVHMSQDAKQWKKDRLRAVGANVIEHAGDYGQACAAARAGTPADAFHHFIDDEASPDLFWGYAVAARELAEQLAARDIAPVPERPLVVYLPCGVGGAPGGITCGLKAIFGDSVICIFVEPTASPCMLTALATGAPASDPPSIYALGLDNRTVADGLAVAQASPFVLSAIGNAIDAAISVSDSAMLRASAEAWECASLRLEPSAAASLVAIPMMLRAAKGRADWPDLGAAVHVAWATGGALLPDAEWHDQLAKADADTAGIFPDLP